MLGEGRLMTRKMLDHLITEAILRPYQRRARTAVEPHSNLF